MEKAGFDSWAIVELMGHSRIAGKVTEAEIGGGKLLRIDVPAVKGRQPMTKFFGTAAVYAITPVDEETAGMAAEQCDPAPVDQWSARRMLEQREASTTKSRLLAQQLDDEEDGEDFDPELTTHD